MNVSGVSRPPVAVAVVPTARATRKKDADGDYDGPPKTATAVAPKAAASVVANGKVDVHA